VWIQLDRSSAASYCHDEALGGDAWCLVSGVDGQLHLSSSPADLQQQQLSQRPAFRSLSATHSQTQLGGDHAALMAVKGFDFTTASTTPTFTQFTATSLPRTYRQLPASLLDCAGFVHSKENK